jgi:hypothetical protein
VNFLAKKKGEKYKCDECGLVVLVEDVCGCEDCDVVCCGVPMKQVKEEKPKPEAKHAPKAAKSKK